MTPNNDRDNDINSESKPAFVMGAIAGGMLIWALIFAALSYVRA